MPIHVINADGLLDLEFIEDDALTNASVATAYQRHVRKGLDLRMLKICSPRSIDPRYSISNADLLAAEQAEIRGEPVFICMLGLGVGRTFQMLHVEDWLSELKLRDPRVYGTLHKMSFQQMYDHSCKWHDAMDRRARRLQDHGVPHDPEGAPVVLQMDGELSGWTVVWLRNNEARDTEGFVMGNCVGGGVYDRLRSTEAVFSLRDHKNAPHATIYVNSLDDEDNQGLGRGNEVLTERYQVPAERIMKIMSLRMMVSSPTEVLADGFHSDCLGMVYHVRNEVLHREDGPAKYDPAGIEEYWCRDGNLRRANGDLPAVIHSSGDLGFWDDDGDECEPDHPVRKIEAVSVTTEYYSGGKLHRDGGPARIRERGEPLSDEVEFWQHGVQVKEDGSPIARYTGDYSWLGLMGRSYVHPVISPEDVTVTLDIHPGEAWWPRQEAYPEVREIVRRAIATRMADFKFVEAETYDAAEADYPPAVVWSDITSNQELPR